MDIELAHKVVAYLERNPYLHSQSTFLGEDTDCGTTACIAGHAMLLSGDYQIKKNINGFRMFSHIDELNTLIVDNFTEGRTLLGLNSEEAERLFYELQDEGEALDYLRELISEHSTK